LLFTITTTNGFYSPLPSSKSGLKLVCNLNIVYRNLKSENSRNKAQKPQRNCTFMNSASVLNKIKLKKLFLTSVIFPECLSTISSVLDVHLSYMLEGLDRNNGHGILCLIFSFVRYCYRNLARSLTRSRKGFFLIIHLPTL
jgi:hypothetical protein